MTAASVTELTFEVSCDAMVAPCEAVGEGVCATADLGRMGTTLGGTDDWVCSSSSDSEASPGTIMAQALKKVLS